MATEITEYSRIEAALSILREKYQGSVYDVSTRERMKDAKQARADLRFYRVELEKVRKEIKAPALKRCNDIDAEARRITKALSALEDPIASAIKAEEDRLAQEKRDREMAEENARKAREESERAAIEEIRAPLLGLIGCSSAEIAKQILATTCIDTKDVKYGKPIERVSMTAGGEAHDFIDRAEVAKSETLAKLSIMHADALKREEADARLKELRELRESAEESRKEVERLRFVEDVAPVVDDLSSLRREAREALADIVLRFSEIPELSPVISSITAYLKGNP